MINSPKVAIVIVTWNKVRDVMNLLRSLKDNSYDNYDTIVVDNASTDGTSEAIRKEYPHVDLIVNPENLGGTGGFNTGMRYVLKKCGYKYAWLLDNDAEVERDTLTELVAVMEKDDKTGIVGSMIMEPDREYIVELGSFVDWPFMRIKPNLRSEKASQIPYKDAVEIEYVAACSALVRVEVLEKIGVMDERYFLYWDDIDYSLRIKESGYNVKATPMSRAYHGVENKPFNLLSIYYHIRNGLLTVSKHQSGLSRFIYIMNMLRGLGKGMVYGLLTGLNVSSKFIFTSVWDFMSGKFYKSGLSGKVELAPVKNTCSIKDLNLNDKSKILILPNGNSMEIRSLVETLRAVNKNCHISLLIQSERKELYKDLPIDDLIVFEGYKQSTLQTISLLNTIRQSKFDCGISPSPTLLPFSHAVGKYYLYNSKNSTFSESKEDLRNSWKLFAAFLGGEALAMLLMPFVYAASFKYESKG